MNLPGPRLLAAVGVAVMLCGGSAVAGAQRRGGVPMMPQGAPQQPTGSVSGHVFCGDTQRPARFAEIQLIAIPEADVGERPRFGPILTGRSALDGSFNLGAVPVGNYYAAARVPGYVDAPMGSPEALAAAALPQVHVEANRTSEAEIIVRRGAAVSGHVLYDDGTPAGNVQVFLRDTAVGAQNGPRVFGVNSRMATSDDRGLYRIAGVAAGQYFVSATVMTGSASTRLDFNRPGMRMMGDPIVVYAPHGMHRSEAKTVEIRGGEEITDIDITVALQGLHVVHGSVLALDDSRPLAQGYVTLTDAEDSGFVRRAQLDANGMYEFSFVPPGSYSVTASASDTPRPGEQPRHYGSAKVNLAVSNGDVAAENLLLPTAGTTASATENGGARMQ